MKESKLIEMQNRIANLEGMLRQMIPELQKLSNVAFGVFETIKLMPGYDKAIENGCRVQDAKRPPRSKIWSMQVKSHGEACGQYHSLCRFIRCTSLRE